MSEKTNKKEKMSAGSDVMEAIISLCKRRGFIYQGSEIYGGLAGTWDYGPYGVALKNNIKATWWKCFVDDRDDMYGMDAAILMNSKAWVASGHVGGFSDPMVECLNKKCKKRFRVDQLLKSERDYTIFLNSIEESIPNSSKKSPKNFDFDALQRLYDYAKSNKLLSKLGEDDSVAQLTWDALPFARKYLGPLTTVYLALNADCPNCGAKGGDAWGWPQAGKIPQEPRQFNMMFKTTVGAVESEDSISYLRPETAQGMFVNFKNIMDSFHPKLPFGMAQIGKAFRNEIAPRDYLFRAREFEQMEVEYFIDPKDWEKQFDIWEKIRMDWCLEIGLPREKIHLRDHAKEELSHYSKKTTDIEFDYPFGQKELYGLAYRTDFDLKAHSTTSGVDLSYFDEETKQRFIPHVIEPSVGVDRTVLAVLTSAYVEDEMGGEKRTYLRLAPSVAPVKVAVFPLLKNKPELVKKAREIFALLKKEFKAVEFDDNGNIGKRYRRQDEIGTPFCVTIDFDTIGDGPLKGGNGTVTVRYRDTGKQETVREEELVKYLSEKLS